MSAARTIVAPETSPDTRGEDRVEGIGGAGARPVQADHELAVAGTGGGARVKTGRVDWVAAAPFWAVHVFAVVGVILLGFSWKGLALAIALYYIRIFGVTAGYHRYFAHKTFKTGRVMQFLFAVLAQSSTQKGVLWWAGHHRIHHKFSDKPEDVHSMKLRGFFWSHVGWILSHDHDRTEIEEIQDFAKYPELRWLDRYHVVPSVVLGTSLFLIGGWWALVWGYAVSTVICWHGTFTINSLAHWLGRRRYATTDESRNSLLLALLTMGEGWHNNHHYYPRACNQGFYWWEIDLTYYVIRLLAAVGLVWDVETPPKKIRDRRMTARRSQHAAEPAAQPAVVDVAPAE